MTGHVFHEKYVLITGGLGFVGSNLARRLVDLGAHVILVDSLIPESFQANPAAITGRIGMRLTRRAIGSWTAHCTFSVMEWPDSTRSSLTVVRWRQRSPDSR